MILSLEIKMTDSQFELLAEAIAEKVAAKMKSEEAHQAPIPLKKAAPMVGKSVTQLRREVNAGLVKRVPGPAKILIPFPEIKRLRDGEAISK